MPRKGWSPGGADGVHLAGDGRQLVWNERTDESDLWLATFDTAP